MKKLLVLALVLSMATIASATITMTISGPTEVDPGTQTVYTVGYSGDESILSSDNDILATAGSLSGAVIITTSRDTALDIIQTNPISGNYQVAITNDILATNMGSPLFSFVFDSTGVAPGSYVTLSLLDNGAMFDLSWNQVVPQMQDLVVHITPEPITMTLLGLGGLFLRRRSK